MLGGWGGKGEDFHLVASLYLTVSHRTECAYSFIAKSCLSNGLIGYLA